MSESKSKTLKELTINYMGKLKIREFEIIAIKKDSITIKQELIRISIPNENLDVIKYQGEKIKNITIATIDEDLTEAKKKLCEAVIEEVKSRVNGLLDFSGKIRKLMKEEQNEKKKES